MVLVELSKHGASEQPVSGFLIALIATKVRNEGEEWQSMYLIEK